jgi:hypothetical protein
MLVYLRNGSVDAWPADTKLEELKEYYGNSIVKVKLTA